MPNTILTYEEAKERDLECRCHGDDVFAFLTEDKYWHLLIRDRDVLKGKKAVDYWYYGHGVYEYIKEGDKYYHLIIDGKDVLEGKEAVKCDYLRRCGFVYKDKDGHRYRIMQNTDGGFEYEKL